MNRKRLEHLITVLEGVKARSAGFYMGAWATTVQFAAVRNAITGTPEPCGTVCCAMGYAALDDEFMKHGLRLEDDLGRGFGSISEFNEAIRARPHMSAAPTYDDYKGVDEAVVFFDIDPDCAEDLFDTPGYPRGPITPDMVIAKVRALLDGNAP